VPWVGGSNAIVPTCIGLAAAVPETAIRRIAAPAAARRVGAIMDAIYCVLGGLGE
jgi:hypothetical protein